MTGDMLFLERLRVRRVPGIDETYVIDGLVPGVNLVYGRNGSGKTSTTRAIDAALWPRSAEDGIVLAAEYRLGDTRYHLELEGRHARVRRDGAECDPPAFPLPDLRRRYQLALHDLLACDDGEFAALIARESAGGVDVAGAAASLGFRDAPRSGIKGTSDLAIAKKDVRDRQQAQADLEQRSRTLERLEADLRATHDAARRVALLQATLRHLHARAEQEAREAVLQGYPPAMHRVTGDEGERIRRLRDQIATCDAGLRQTAMERDRATDEASRLLPQGTPVVSPVPALRQVLADHGAQEREVREADRRLAESRAELAKARQALGMAADDALLSTLTVDSLDGVVALAREVEDVRARLDATREEIVRAGSDVPQDNLDTLRDGSRLLARWLRTGAPEPEREGRLARVLWALAALAMIAAVLLAIHWHWAFGALGAVALGLAMFAGRGRVQADGRADVERQYTALGVDRPAAWTDAEVTRHADRLQAAIAKASVAADRARWRAEAEQRLTAIEAEWRELDERRAELSRRYGAAPDTDARKLSFFIAALTRWQQATQRAAGAEAAVTAGNRALQDALDKLIAMLSPWGLTPTDGPTATGMVTELEERIERHAKASADAREAAARHDAPAAEMERLQGERSDILAILDAPDNDAEVERLCSLHAAFAEARQRAEDARAQADMARGDLARTDGFHEGLLEADGLALEVDLAEARGAAAERDGVVDRIATIKTEVRVAEQGIALEEALAAFRDAQDRLREERGRDVAAVLGDLLVAHVQEETRDAHLPAVFGRARELFGAITKGAYRLEFGAGETASFCASDTTTGAYLQLGQLSSATKLQLLLAVRVAFVESNEQGTKLPLVLDETLSTSDDVRARAMIEAVAALAKAGRQVFYFTAQKDEVGKWLSILDARGVVHNTLDIGDIRRLRVTEPGYELPIASVSVGTIPEPNGCSHDDYGVMLGVPAIVSGQDIVGSTPVWYLFDDPTVVHRLHSVGVERWGQVELLASRGDPTSLVGSPEALRRASALVRVLDELHRCAAIGRGRKVDRSVLAASG